MGRTGALKQPEGYSVLKKVHVQFINLGELAGRHQSLLGDGMGIGQWMGSNCVMNHLFLGFITFSLSLILLVLLLCFIFSQVFYIYI